MSCCFWQSHYDSTRRRCVRAYGHQWRAFDGTNVVTTNKCRFINYRRKALAIPGQIDRDQRAGMYLLVDGDKRTELGKRWRQAVHTLETMTGKESGHVKRR